MKTLRELWTEAGEKPFDAIECEAENAQRIHCNGISPEGGATGWTQVGRAAWWLSDVRKWQFAPKKPKLVTWWRPTFMFHKQSEYKNGRQPSSSAVFFRSKEEGRKFYSDCKIEDDDWETKERPEIWEDL